MRYWREENELKRRWQTQDVLAEWMIEKECNYFGTATFNRSNKGDVTVEGAEQRLRHFYNRQMRKLLGPRWYKHKQDQQPFCLATLEYGTVNRIGTTKDDKELSKLEAIRRKFKAENDIEDMRRTTAIHWHLHYKIRDDLVDKFNGIEHSKIWQRMNGLHRHFDLRHLETADDLRRTAHYAVKQVWMRDEGGGYVLCGKGTN